jgi:hypothetical protein
MQSAFPHRLPVPSSGAAWFGSRAIRGDRDGAHGERCEAAGGRHLAIHSAFRDPPRRARHSRPSGTGSIADPWRSACHEAVCSNEGLSLKPPLSVAGNLTAGFVAISLAASLITMSPMYRTQILSAVVASLLALLLASAATGSTTPRGVLTHAEYQELLANQKTLAHAKAGANPTRACRALTGLSHLTETQHSECLTELPFFTAFLNFDHAVNHCQKSKNAVTDYLCIYEVVDGLYKDTVAFLNTNRTATAAVTQRGLTGKCFDDLVFTRNQTRAMTRLATGLHKFARDVMHINVPALKADQHPVDADIASAANVMLVSATVTVCRHE